MSANTLEATWGAVCQCGCWREAHLHSGSCNECRAQCVRFELAVWEHRGTGMLRAIAHPPPPLATEYKSTCERCEGISDVVLASALRDSDRWVTYGPLSVAVPTGTIRPESVERGLTRMERHIIRLLVIAAPCVVAYRRLRNSVVVDPELDAHAVRVHVCRLREKVKPLGLSIPNLKATGYRLEKGYE